MILSIENLVKRYGDFLALDNVNMKIGEGEIVGFLGPNGAGKTTTINTILGLSKIDSGEIKVFGKNLKESEIEIKRDIGIVPQEIAIYDDLTAYENVSYFGSLYGIRGSLLKERSLEALKFTGLIDKEKDFPKKFSGGMKRRLNIACAIVHHPKLIIMDEPTVGIDPQSRKHILNSVKELNKMGSTVIYTSHYMEEVEEICTDIIIMDLGRVIAKGTKEELKDLVAVEERVKIEVSSLSFTLIEKIKGINGVKECSIEGNELFIISKKGSGNLGKIIDAIVESGSEVVSVNMEKPTLESVFLTLTGKKLRD
ncbi:MAG TPA: export ABC transporter ATP-binding protein [Clostridiaceae bacterium]|jgi:ABC-2 type transport system ATP-binding protein|nr:export ABC transporter ATP-binding protein [Clostridiaceae bacterium]HBN28056.1 export ABC transporter ATP-binding protein [Clostridiaceae bacterium]HBX49384.1 export ABC transporter ATP-binding protein [Clostridiaceae bacterium]HCL49932.1 export ABC transporter ATP-binding protein [Clostridiaceae bacterium]